MHKEKLDEWVKALKNIPHQPARYRMMIREGLIFKEIFIQQPYLELYENLKPNTTLIDIGAYFGETAVYFAQNAHAKRIIAYELVPNSFEKARENIRMSPFANKIELHNTGLSSTPGNMTLSRSFMGGISAQMDNIPHRGGKHVPITTLPKVLAGLKNVAIKCDAEGVERDLFDNTDMKNVYAIMVECHNCKKRVSKVLESKGFKVHDSYPNLQTGIMYAQKRNNQR